MTDSAAQAPRMQRRRTRDEWREVALLRVRAELARRGVMSVPWPTISWILAPVLLPKLPWADTDVYLLGVCMMLPWMVLRYVMLFRARNRGWQIEGGWLGLSLAPAAALMWSLLTVALLHSLNSWMAEFYFTLIAACVVAASPFTLAPSLRILVIFNLSVCVPLLAWLVMRESSEHANFCLWALLLSSFYSLGLTRLAYFGFRRNLLSEITSAMRREHYFYQSGMDGLTGLLNRRRFIQLAQCMLSLRERRPGAFCVAMVDVDHFKAVNDKFGHGVGDSVLRACSAQLRQFFKREADVVARLGGEEFSALFAPESLIEAQQSLDRLLETLEKATVATAGGPISVTASVGAVFLPAEVRSPGLIQLLEKADQSLYAAKAAGRNRAFVVQHSEGSA